MIPGGFGGPKLIVIGLIALAVLWGVNGFYRVQPNQQGIEMVFGKYNGVPTQAGLNWNWPSPIGKVFLPDVTRENQIEIGYRSAGEGISRSSARRDVPEESQMITGDENIVDMDFFVLWRIQDAGDYLFNLQNPRETVKITSEAVMRDIIGRRDFQGALTADKAAIETEALSNLQSLLDEYGAGIEIRQVSLEKVDPPTEVIDAFNEVVRARQDLDQAKNRAEAYRNQIVPEARGDAARLVEEADAYRQEVINRAQGDANRFDSVYQAYSQSKDVTTKRIYLETLEEVLGNVNKVIIDGEGGGSGVVPYLPLPEIQRRAKKAEPASTNDADNGGSN
jgi:membrane protease subunit HflK